MAYDPPVMEARRWIAGRSFPADRPLLNLSQAAPVDPPPEDLRQAIADAALNTPQAHLYGPVLGMPELREEIAAQWSAAYGGDIAMEDVAVTPGCNQAFCALMSTIAGPGDAVLLPSPWYFNHKMWLDITGVEARPLPCDGALVPILAEAEARMAGVKAIVLITPNNPTGAEYPAGVVQAFAELARRHGAMLVLDETYRDFDSREGAPHALFQDPSWRDHVVQLYSFSKAYRLTGHRVGAAIASPLRLAQAEKFLDTVTICTSQLGQIAALHGLRHLAPFVAEQRREILARRAVVMHEFRQALPEWELMGCGAYFAWLRHPFAESSAELAKALVEEQSLLMLPGTMFTPGDDPLGPSSFRMAFANADADGLREALARLAAFTADRKARA
ncbi:aminotransferase [Albimonas sp. CAU 1670]|uniref:aminotransferase n=1 Tax=Albimonas sp. CAU 1670 TaxID=3032599 RepID=UPI0023DB3AB3|nr:aminotransferase [Albimonas sp. CAU 1670]MDF2234237.1 aminotransferase [Albimonas sp. CAU 1670]